MKILLGVIAIGVILIRGIVPPSGGGSPVAIDTSIAFVTAVMSDPSHQISITVGNNSNRVLYVCSGSGVANGTDEISTVSSNLDGAFTEVSVVSDGNWMNGQVWRLINPTVGTHTITISTPDEVGQNLSGAISFYNVDQTTPNDTPATTNGSGTSVSASATLGANDMAIGFLFTDSETNVTVTSGTQQRELENAFSDVAASIATNTGTGSVSIAWSQNNTGYTASVIGLNAAP